MRMLSLRTPAWIWLVLLVGALVGGWTYNTVHAHGRLVAEGTGEPITIATLNYGVRSYQPNDKGEFDIPDLPRGARITVIAPGWTRKEFAAEETEVRLTVGVVNFNVFDATNDKLLNKPEAHDAIDVTKTLGVGSETGSIAVPLPPAEILICAKDYGAMTVKVTRPVIDVKLQPRAGQVCPAPPPPSPTPTAAPSPTAVPSQSPAGSPAASPTPSPTP